MASSMTTLDPTMTARVLSERLRSFLSHQMAMKERLAAALIERQAEEIEALRAEKFEQGQKLHELAEGFLVRAEVAEAKVAKAREALAFYAEAWEQQFYFLSGDTREDRLPNDALYDDEGQRARDALAALGEQEEQRDG